MSTKNSLDQRVGAWHPVSMFMNTVKTFILLGIMTALFGFIGLAVAGQQGMIMALVMAAGTNLFAWWGSGSHVLKVYKAQPIQDGRIYQMTEELVMEAGLPMPGVYMLNNPQPNAFATGRNPNKSAVAVSSGIVDLLSEKELRGVIAHELAHIKHRDTLTMTVAATLAGALAMLSRGMMFSRGGNSQRQGRSGGALILVMMVLAPVAAMIIRMTISRTREYEADREGAEIAQDPIALANALQKIEHYARGIPNEAAERHPATSHMFIINPLNFNPLRKFFSTHPPTEKRIAALQEMANEGLSNRGVGSASYGAGSAGSSLGPGNPWEK